MFRPLSAQPVGDGFDPFDGHDDVGWDAQPGCRLEQRLGVRCLVEAVRLLPVCGQERVEPADADVVIDERDARTVELVRIELLGEIAFDDVQRHVPSLLTRPRRFLS